MIRIPKSIVSFGALALAAGALTLTAPRAAHAFAAALVQVANTAANPAITQSTPTQAAQLVQLNAEAIPIFAGESIPATFASTPGQPAPYSVPANQSLVVTAIDMTTPFPCSSVTFQVIVPPSTTLWTVTAPNTGHFVYPSGIVLPPGTTPITRVFSTSPCGSNVGVTLFGYLTSN